MKSLLREAVRFLKKEDGPTAIEYSVMLALIVVVCIVAVSTVGANTNSSFTNIGAKIKAASS